MSEAAILQWEEAGESCRARWRSEAGVNPARRVMVVDETIAADAAYRLASEGTALLWRGDFQNARQILNALARRADRRNDRRADKKNVKGPTPPPGARAAGKRGVFQRPPLGPAQRA